jgi:hypothetical protein
MDVMAKKFLGLDSLFFGPFTDGYQECLPKIVFPGLAKSKSFLFLFFFYTKIGGLRTGTCEFRGP